MSNNLRTRNGMPFNFVNGLKVRGMDIESLIPGIEGIPEAGSKYQFAGDGTNKSFTLPVSPYNKDAVDVYVKQLYVHPDDYTLVGDTVTLVEAPPAVVVGETYNVVIKVSLTTLNGYVNANRVSFEGENLDDILEKGKPLANYSNLRAYAGASTQVRITDPGIAGFFYYDASDTTSADNGGTIIVASNSKRWKRLYDGAVNVKWFGANGNGADDDTLAIQDALDTGGDVICQDPSYLISAPLQIGSQRLIGGRGEKWTNRTQSRLIINGNHPAFINKAGFPSFDIDGFFIDYGDVTPTDAATSSEKIGFKFTTNSGTWPEYLQLKNCTVRGAWYGYYDNTGTYLSKLQQIACRKTRIGFYKTLGTTIDFDTCSSSDGIHGFNIFSVLSATLRNCAADSLTITDSNEGKTGNNFRFIPALTIIGWDAEYNTIINDSDTLTPDLVPSYMRFHNTSATVAGIATIQNIIMSNKANSGGTFFMIGDNSTVQLSGFDPQKEANDLVFTGTLSPCHTVYGSNSSKTTIVGCDVKAPTGGSPTTRYSVFGTLSAYLALINSQHDNAIANVNMAVEGDTATLLKISSTSVKATATTSAAIIGSTTSIGGGQQYGGFGAEVITAQKDGNVALFSVTSAAGSGVPASFARGNTGALQYFFRNGIAVGRIEAAAGSTRYFLTNDVFVTSGPGTPEGSLPAPVGSMYTRTDGGPGSTLYVKQSGTGTTGWVAK